MAKRKATDRDKLVPGNIKRLREIHELDRRALEEKAGIAYGILDQIETFHPKKSIYRRGRRENILIFKQNKYLRVNTQKVNREISVLSCY